MGKGVDFSLQSRQFHYALSGKTLNDGRSPSLPFSKPQEAINAGAALNPTPGDTARVREAEGGTYSEGIVLADSVIFEGFQTAITTADPIGVVAADNITFDAQAIVNTADSSIGLKIDGTTNFGVGLAAIQSLGAGSTGIQVIGSNQNLFIETKQLAMSGLATKGVDFTGDTNTPADFNFDTVTFAGDNEVFFNFSPSNATSRASVRVSTVFRSLPLPSGAKGFVVGNGVVEAFVGSMQAETAFEVSGTGIIAAVGNGVSGNAVSANTGIISLSAFSRFIGDLNSSDTSVIQADITNITGNATVNDASFMSIEANFFDGEIVVDANSKLFAIINTYTGTMPVNDGRVDGIINGVRYGNWIVDILDTITSETDKAFALRPDGNGGVEWVYPYGAFYMYDASEAESSTSSQSFQNKVSLVTAALPAGNYRVSWQAEVANDSGDKPVEIRGTIDAVEVGNTFYAPKFEDEFLILSGFNEGPFTAGVHTLNLDFRATSEGGTAKIRKARVDIHYSRPTP